MNHGDIEAIVYRCIERMFGGRFSERHGMVTAYDPIKYLAKVKYQPGGQESGWLPIETGHIGDNYGMAVGLQPGDGQKTGDQVIVRFQEGDFESGKIVQRVHSSEDKPPNPGGQGIQSGEMIIWNKFKKSGGDDDSAQGGQGGTGQYLYFKNDGSTTLTDGNGATHFFDGAGNVTLTTNNLTHNINGNHTVNIQGNRSMMVNGNDSVTIQQDKTVMINGKRYDQLKKPWKTDGPPSVWPWLGEDDG